MRFAVVAALAIHAVVIAWLAPREREATFPPPALPLPPHPSSPFVEVVLLDEPTQQPIVGSTRAKVFVSTRSKVSTHSKVIASIPASTATGTSDVTPEPPAVAHHYFAMRGPDLSTAQVVDHQSAVRGGEGPSTTGDSELRPSGNGTFTTDLGGSNWRTRTATAHVARDGTVHFENAPDFDIHFALIGIVGKFNVDDWLARKHGEDPYASAKLAYLDRTRDERARIAEINRTDDLAHAQRAMQRNVEVARAIVDPAARKQALFELWDDVAETGDDALVRAGADARAYLVGAIRAMRPALQFTPDELAQLNAHRHSSAVFAPYD